MSVCERRVYPPDVVKYVKAQLKQVPDSPEAANGNLPESMRLTDRMKEDKGLRDALVSSDSRECPVLLHWYIRQEDNAHSTFLPITANQIDH